MENILVVDDEKEIVKIISKILQQQGFFPVQAFSGAQAIEKVKKTPIDIVICDLMMPEMDGIELIRKIREIDDTIMIIMLTGFPSIDSAVEAVKAGAFDYMIKPLQADLLLDKINKCIERKNLLKSRSIIKGVNWALIISIPFWLILGIILAYLIRPH